MTPVREVLTSEQPVRQPQLGKERAISIPPSRCFARAKPCMKTLAKARTDYTRLRDSRQR
jgi:hypothetical protein